MARRIGRFEEATGGTLLLDEVSEMAPHLQAKLLRAIQEREITRVGSNRPIKVDLRIIATTTVDLEDRADRDEFDPVLLGHLFHHRVDVPTLAERREDVPELARAILSRTPGPKGYLTLSSQAAQLLTELDWDQNLEELERALAEAAERCEGSELDVQHLATGLIGELEMPEWVATGGDEHGPWLDLVHAVLLDQCEKGGGYPIVLQEAHERAVVRTREKEMFYSILARQARGAGAAAPTYSGKSASKRMPRV